MQENILNLWNYKIEEQEDKLEKFINYSYENNNLPIFYFYNQNCPPCSEFFYDHLLNNENNLINIYPNFNFIFCDITVIEKDQKNYQKFIFEKLVHNDKFFLAENGLKTIPKFIFFTKNKEIEQITPQWIDNCEIVIDIKNKEKIVYKINFIIDEYGFLYVFFLNKVKGSDLNNLAVRNQLQAELKKIGKISSDNKFKNLEKIVDTSIDTEFEERMKGKNSSIPNFKYIDTKNFVKRFYFLNQEEFEFDVHKNDKLNRILETVTEEDTNNFKALWL